MKKFFPVFMTIFFFSVAFLKIYGLHFGTHYFEVYISMCETLGGEIGVGIGVFIVPALEGLMASKFSDKI